MDRRYDRESVIDVKPLIAMTEDKVELVSNIAAHNGNTVIIKK